MRTQRRADLNEAMTAELCSLVAAVDGQRVWDTSCRDPFEVNNDSWDEVLEQRHIA